MPKRKIELTLPATLKFSSLVRSIATDVFDHVGFTKEWSNRLKLVVDELFMNANRYGSAEGESKIFVQFEYDDSSVTFRIDDEGVGKTKISSQELKEKITANKVALTDLTKTSGRGLALISELWTDGVVIDDSPYGGIMVSFSKAISTETPPAPPMFQAVPTAETSVKVAPALAVAPVALEGVTEVIKITGEVDSSNLDEKIKPMEEKLRTVADGTILVLDCSELVYFNSTFIGQLAAWHNVMQKKNGQLVLKNTNVEVMDVLNLVGLSRVIYIEK